MRETRAARAAIRRTNPGTTANAHAPRPERWLAIRCAAAHTLQSTGAKPRTWPAWKAAIVSACHELMCAARALLQEAAALSQRRRNTGDPDERRNIQPQHSQIFE